MTAQILDLKVEADLDRNGTFSNVQSDISRYVQEMWWQLGATEAWQSVAADTIAEVSLINEDQLFSPAHANAIPGLTKGCPIRISLNVDGGAFQTQMVSWGNDPIPLEGKYGLRTAKLNCDGWFGRIGTADCSIPVMYNATFDAVITAIVDKMAIYPPGLTGYWFLGRGKLGHTTRLASVGAYLDAEVGISTLGVAGDFQAGTKGLGAIRQIVEREGGRIFQRPDGMLELWNRHHIVDALNEPLAGTFDNTMSKMNVQPLKFTNRITVPYRTRKVGIAPESVAVLSDIDQIVPGQTISKTFQYSDPITGARLSGSNAVTPSPGTDFIATLASNGTGSDLSVAIATAITSESANSATVQYTNNGTQSLYLSGYRIRARATRDYGEGTETASDLLSIADLQGVYEWKYPTPLESKAEASGMAKYQRALRATRTAVKWFEINPFYSADFMNYALTYTIGTKVKLIEDQTGSALEYLIVGMRHTIKPGKVWTPRYYVEPLIQRDYWYLGNTEKSRLGHTTRPFPF